MKNKKKPDGAKGLRKWLALQSTAIVIGAVMVFEFVEYMFNVVMHDSNAVYDPILGVGVIVPMGLIMWFISSGTLKAATRYVSILIAGIARVAEGDFEVSLDAKKGGPFKDVFSNFNRMTAELQSVQTLRDDFINHFSHEFKTPIMSINGFALLLLEEKVPEDEKAKYLSIIASESQRLAELSNSTLLLSKLDSQQYIENVQPYCLDEQIRQCVIILSSQLNKRNISFSADLDPVTYGGNAELMQQVWINLLGNAVKYTPERGEVSVSLKTARGMIVVSVSDTGKGMTEEEKSRAFEKYYQGPSSRSTKGLGLGLAIAKRIVDLCEGKIEVQSVLNEGSRFTVYLPVK